MSGPAEQTVPRRVLIVDADERAREAVAGLLRTAQFEVAGAANGAQALTMLAREWYPVVVTDHGTPVLDGIEFVSRLRAISIVPVYVVMMTPSNDMQEHERSYCAGVDHCLAKRDYEAELLARVLTGITAVRRRQSAPTARANEPVTVDLENGAHTARHLIGRLHSEIEHAASARSVLNVVSVGIDALAGVDGAPPQRMSSNISSALLTVVHAAIRPKLDWVARLPAAPTSCRLAIIMPECESSDVAAVEQGIRNGFAHCGADAALDNTRLSVGVATLVTGEALPTALGLLGLAERNRRSQDVAGAAPAPKRAGAETGRKEAARSESQREAPAAQGEASQDAAA